MADSITFQVQGDRSNNYLTSESAQAAARDLVKGDGKPRDIIRVAETVLGTVQPAEPIFVRVP